MGGFFTTTAYILSTLGIDHIDVVHRTVRTLSALLAFLLLRVLQYLP